MPLTYPYCCDSCGASLVAWVRNSCACAGAGAEIVLRLLQSYEIVGHIVGAEPCIAGAQDRCMDASPIAARAAKYTLVSLRLQVSGNHRIEDCAEERERIKAAGGAWRTPSILVYASCWVVSLCISP